MKVNTLVLFLFFLTILYKTVLASDNPTPELDDGHCAYGSHAELYSYFTERNFIVVAQGKRVQTNGDIKDFADVLFLVSPDMEFFHAVTLNGIKYDYFKACIFSSAREIDFQYAPPTPSLLQRKNREHIVFLPDNLPNKTICPDGDTYCTPWSKWSQRLQQTSLLSAYAYSTKWLNDPYIETVELTLGNKIIRPTRGALSEHARTKYALRLRNTLNESNEDAKNAKTAYKQIHDEVDHKLPLVFIHLTATREWSIDHVNRENGLVQTIMHGIELELYPMPSNAYQKLQQSKG